MRQNLTRCLIFFIFIPALQAAGSLRYSEKISLNGSWQLVSKKAGFVYTATRIDDKTPLNRITLPGMFAEAEIYSESGHYHLIKTFTLEELPAQTWGLKLGSIKSADRVLINSVPVGQTGTIGETTTVGFDIERFYKITPGVLKKGRNTVYLHIYDDPALQKAGIHADEIGFEPYDPAMKSFYRRAMWSVALAAGIFMLGIYFLLLYKNIRRQNEILFLALFSLSYAAYLLLLGQLKYFFFEPSLEIKKLEYALVTLCAPFYLRVAHTFTELKYGLTGRFIYYGGFLLALLALVMPDISWLRRWLDPWRVYIITALLYIMGLHLTGLVKARKKHPLLTAAVTLFIIIAVLDVLRLHINFNLPQMLPTASVVVLIIYALEINRRITAMTDSLKARYRQLNILAATPFSSESYSALLADFADLLYRRLSITDFRVKFTDSSGTVFKAEESSSSLKKEKETVKYCEYPLKPAQKERGRVYTAFTDSSENESIDKVLKTAITQLEARLSEIDAREKLNRLNLSLEETVEKRTAEIREQKAELEKLNRIKTDFFAGITHDIRTPLSLIIMPLDRILRNEKNLSEKSLRSIARVKASAYRIIEMISTLLDTARLESGETVFRPVYSDIAAFMRNLSRLYEDAALMNNSALDIQTGTDREIRTVFDPEKIEKIIANLISNAIKFNEPGRRISIQIEPADECIKYSITNRGAGIRHEERRSIFQKYRRAEGSSSPGTGLGLALAKDFALMHEGDLTVESELNSFTTFILRIPVREPRPGEKIAGRISDPQLTLHEVDKWVTISRSHEKAQPEENTPEKNT